MPRGYKECGFEKMNVKQKILELLEQHKTENRPLSGSFAAKAIGVSRNAVWKAIESLRKDGYEISAHTNKGYYLVKAPSQLSAEGIYALYPDCPLKIMVEDCVTSTNSVVKELAQKGEKDVVLFAKSQTNGRGRLGREFISPENTGLYMSVLLRPKEKAEEALFITTSAAVAVARAIEKVSQNRIYPKIKWVNDIFIGDLKVCGILTEAAIDFESRSLEYAVLGIGVNVFPSKEITDSLFGIAGSVFGAGEESSTESPMNALAAAILKELSYALDFSRKAEILDEYKSRSYLDGKRVNVISPKLTYPARVLGIDGSARLIVETEDGEIRTVSTGEVSVRVSEE